MDDPSLSNLPQELLHHIIHYLDSPPPSQSRLHDEPSSNPDITWNEDAPLKALSLVNKRCRKSVLPLLYKHAALIVKPAEHRDDSYQESLDTFLPFVEEHGLSDKIQTFTLCVQEWDSCCQNDPGRSGDHLTDVVCGFWERLFSCIDPRSVTVVASPCTLGYLTDCDIYPDDAWLFDIKYHILHLSYNSTTTSQATTTQSALRKVSSGLPSPEGSVAGDHESSSSTTLISAPTIPPSNLFHLRPWTHIHLNEGSFIKAFHTYEYYHKRPPSLLPSLLGLLGPTHTPATPLFPSTATSFAYIAVFPIQSHFQLITLGLPSLNSIFIQITPNNANPWAENRVEMQRLDVNDLWMERNHCYSMVMRELFTEPPTGNWGQLREFQSGDAADVDAWQLAVGFVERVGGWRVERPGVFVKNEKKGKGKGIAGVDDGEEGEDDGEQDSFNAFSRLRRWAFNGVMKLPVSSINLYVI